jgi:DNA-binding PadR family transcriptional regulator
MRRRTCNRGGRDGVPCTCEMGNLYRFSEPTVLLTLSRLGAAHGYQIAREAAPLCVTHAGLDNAAVYRTLRQLEAAGCVTSRWDTRSGGPARRVYALTALGSQHLSEWMQVMQGVVGAMTELLRQGRKVRRSRLLARPRGQGTRATPSGGARP